MPGSLVNTYIESAAPPAKSSALALRARTAWPYVAAILSLLAGAVLAIVAHAQIDSGDDIGKYVGYWNAFVTLFYVGLSVRLVLKHVGAYKMGLDLSRTNIWFVFGQMQFWNMASRVTGMSLDEQFLITGFAFIATDVALYAGVLMTRRDLISPLRAEDVPDRTSLVRDLERADELSQAERKQFLDLRRRFIAHMSRVSSGGIEVDGLHKLKAVDLIVRPALFPVRIGDSQPKGGKAPEQKRRPNWGTRAYSFQSEVSREYVQYATVGIDYIVAVSACDKAVEEARKCRRVGLYLIRQGVYVGRRSAAFEQFVAQEYAVSFTRR